MKTIHFPSIRPFFFFLIIIVLAGFVLIELVNFDTMNFIVSIRESNDFIIEDESSSFIFDTGANGTILFSNTPPKGCFNTFLTSTIKDINHKTTKSPIYYAYKSRIAWMTLHNKILLIQKEKQRPSFVESDGIIGTNIILKHNWLFDLKNKTAECMPHKNNYAMSPADMVLRYRISKGKLFTDMKIGDVLLENAEIDTGYSGADFMVNKNQIRLNRHEFISRDTMNGFNSQEVVEKFMLPPISLNDNINIQDMTIAFSHSPLHLIGIRFFRHFSRFYIDTKHKKIFLYL